MTSVTTVQQVSIPLIEDYSNPANALINAAIIAGEEVGESVLEYGLNNLKHVAEAFYNNGKNNYVDGLPVGTASNWVIDLTLLQPIMESVIGYPVVVTNAEISSASAENYALSKLSAENDFDITTGILGAHSFNTSNDVSLDRVDEILGSYDSEADVIVKNQAACYVFVDGVSTLIFQDDFYTEMTALGTPMGLAIGVTYTYLGKSKMFYYYHGQGIAALDAAMLDTKIPKVYPVVAIRIDSVNINEGTDTVRTASTESILKHLGLDLTDLSTQLADNANIDIIEEAQVVLATDVLDSTNEVIAYHISLFESILLKYPEGKLKYDEWYTANSSFTWYGENIFEGEYNNKFRLNYIESNVVDKIIGAIGAFSVETAVLPKHKGVDVSLIRYYEQISASQCKEIIVNGLFSYYRIYGKESRVYLSDATKSDDSGSDLTLHLNHDVLLPMPTNKANVVVSTSIRLNIFAVQVQKLKWYQTGLFKAITVFVAVVYYAYTLDPTALLLLTTAEAIAFVVITLLDKLILSYVITQAALILADLVGGKLALIITTAIAIYALVNGGIGFDIPILGSVDTTMMMSSLITASNTQNISEYIEESSKIKDEVAEAEAKLDELEDELPEDKSWLSESFIHPNSPVFLFDETPDSFLTRTTEVGYTLDLGTFSIDNFYENTIILDLVDDY